jgi:hypothetical protein
MILHHQRSQHAKNHDHHHDFDQREAASAAAKGFGLLGESAHRVCAWSLGMAGKYNSRGVTVSCAALLVDSDWQLICAMQQKYCIRNAPYLSSDSRCN